MFVNKHFIYLGCVPYISESKQYYIAKPSAYYFYVKTKVLTDFHICISVPLRTCVFKHPLAGGAEGWRDLPCPEMSLLNL